MFSSQFLSLASQRRPRLHRVFLSRCLSRVRAAYRGSRRVGRLRRSVISELNLTSGAYRDDWPKGTEGTESEIIRRLVVCFLGCKNLWGFTCKACGTLGCVYQRCCLQHCRGALCRGRILPECLQHQSPGNLWMIFLAKKLALGFLARWDSLVFSRFLASPRSH